MTSLDSAHETIAIFNRQIAEAEGEARQHVERLVAAGLTYDSEQVKKAWDDCALRLRMVRASRESLVQAIVTIAGMTAPSIVRETVSILGGTNDREFRNASNHLSWHERCQRLDA